MENVNQLPSLQFINHPTKKLSIPIINLGNTENRFTFEVIDKLLELLDEAEKVESSDNKAVILTGEGKFFSNGLSFEQLATQAEKLLISFHKLLRRVLSFPLPTIAAINGHAFAGGAMLALACDYRVMNSERGFLCINEVSLGLPLTPGMQAVIRSKISRNLWTQVMLEGKRFTASELLSKNIIQVQAKSGDEVTSAEKLALHVARPKRSIFAYRSIKALMFSSELDLLDAGCGDAEIAAKQLSAKM